MSQGLDRLLPTYARADLRSCAATARGSGTPTAASTSTSEAGSPSSRSATAIRRRSPPRASSSSSSGTRPTCTAPSRRRQLAARLSDRFGGAQAFFCNSGAEAIEAALKYARKATGKPGVVALEGSFHGRTLGALSATGQPAKRAAFSPLVPGVRFVPPNDVDALRAAATDDVGLVLLEPILGEGGVHPLDPEFVAAAAELPGPALPRRDPDGRRPDGIVLRVRGSSACGPIS